MTEWGAISEVNAHAPVAHHRIMKIEVLHTVRGESFGKLRTCLSNHERPFDELRANGISTFPEVNEKGY